MKRVVLLKSISRQYMDLQNKVKKNHRIIDAMKLFVTIFIFLVTIGVYGFYVNVSSTKGFTLRQEMKKLEEAKFANSIVQLEVLNMEKQIWEKTQDKYEEVNRKKLTINEKVKYINVISSLAKK